MDTDHNLLFGVLALQLDLLDNDRFAEACSAWATRKTTPLADLLVERGWLSEHDRAEVERLLQRKLKKHSGDARASLAEVASQEVQRHLSGLGDPDIQHTLAGCPVQSQIALGTTAYQPEGRGRYTLTHLHASGGIGHVWLARDQQIGRDVALKEPRKEQASHPALLARFLNEAKITGQLEHPCIVPVYELAHQPDEQHPYYTMRFIKGRTLAEGLRDFHNGRKKGKAGSLELRTLLGAFVAVCNAIGYAHSRGVIHRDLKPQNVILGDYGEVIVLDWGLAKVVDAADSDIDTEPPIFAQELKGQQTQYGQVLGTPAYMSPEQAAGRLDLINRKTDVYGLGAMLYEILTGEAPYSGADTRAVVERVLREVPVKPRQHWSALPAALQAICLKAMARLQADRYESATDLARDIQHWLADEPVSVYRAPFSERLALWARRHQALAAGLISLLATAVIGLSVGLVLLQQSNQKTERQRVLAELNFGASINIVTSTILSVDKKLEESTLPGVHPLRKQILEQQLQQLESYPPEYKDNPRLRTERGRAYFELGKLRRDLGTQAEAVDALNKSLRIREAERATSTDPVARVHFTLGQVFLNLGKPEQAIEPLLRAKALTEENWKRIASEGKDPTPQEPLRGWSYVESLAWIESYLALAQSRAGQSQIALQSFERSRALFEELVQDRNRSLDTYAYFPNGLGFCLLRWGQHYQERGQRAEALACYQRALVVSRQAVKLESEKPSKSIRAPFQFKSVLGFGLCSLATLHLQADETARAEVAFEEALGIFRELDQTRHDELSNRVRHAMTLAGIGHLRLRTGQLEAAEKAFQEAITLTDQLAKLDAEYLKGVATGASARRGLALVHLRRDQPREALAMLRQAIALGTQAATHTPTARYELAGAQALASLALARSKPSLSDANKKEHDLWIQQALASLAQAIRIGYRHTAWMQIDPALEPLRARTEFRDLLAEAKKPSEGIKP